MKQLASIPFLLTILSAQVPPDLAAKIREEGFERSQVMHILDQLTNDIGARLTGSENFARACRWAEVTFKAYGLHNVHLEEWGEFPVGWDRGQWSGRVLQPRPLELVVASPAWTPGTKGRRGGRLVRMPKEVEDLEALRGELAGIYLYGRRPTGEVGNALRALIDSEGCLGYVNRSAERYPNRIRVFGNHRINADRLPKVPEIVVRQDHADQIEQMLEEGKEILVEFDMRNQFRPGPIKLHNVIAEIPGSEKPDEVVIVCGHLDSWHQATGTTDNGTGVASTIESARILSAVGARPRRTIRFILWGGEEQGLLGSVAYVRRHRTEMDKVSAVYNHDTGTNWAHSLGVTDAQRPDLELAFGELKSLPSPDPDHDGPVFVLNTARIGGGGGGSDHASFLSAGVPAWSWSLRGRSDYFNYTWHTQWDTYDVAIPEYMRHTSTVVAIAALGTANLPNLLSREGVERARGTDLQPVLEGALGVELEGLKCKTVKPDGPAAKAGIKAGDVFASAEGEKLEDLVGLQRALRTGGEEGARITLRRADAEVSVIVKAQLPARGRRGRDAENQATTQPTTQPARQASANDR
jgi:hypothetical protein